MKILSWNVQGINAPEKCNRINSCLDSIQCDLVLLQETKLSTNNFQKSVGCWLTWNSSHVPSLGASGGITVLWNPKTIKAQHLHQGTNWQMVSIQHYELSFHLINVYGPTPTSDKLSLWFTLTSSIQQLLDAKFIIAGDFNAFLHPRDKYGGIIPPPRAIQGFNVFVNNNALFDVPSQVGSFIWTNRRVGFLQIVVRLDRFLCSQCWELVNYSIQSDILPYLEFDHFPIQLYILPSDSPLTSFSRPSFKFESV